MRTHALLCALALACPAAFGQVVLSVDFNDRSTDPSTVTLGGFSSFLIASNISATAIQTNATARTFGAYTVTVSGAGANPGYDDRLRTTAQGPTNQVDFTESLLLRDFIFSPDTGSGGLNVTVDGLTPNEAYLVSIWSFDTQNTGNRTSDWLANGTLVRDNYVFNGSTLPTNNAQYKITFKARASGAGQLALQGRRDASSVAGIAVFINALQLEVTTGDPASITGNPTDSTLYARDNAIFSAQSGGTAPVALQWFKDGTNEVAGATNNTLNVIGAELSDAGSYTMVASNATGMATSAPAALVVLPATNINNGLIVHWPLDSIVQLGNGAIVSPDGAGSHFLQTSNMDSSFIVSDASPRIRSAAFYGTNALFNTNMPGDQLPVTQYPAYTIAMWVKGNYVGQSDRRVFAQASTNTSTPLLSIGTDNTGAAGGVDIYIRNDNGSNPVNHRKSSLVAFDGSWHHIAWVDNNGSGAVYVDGVRDTNNFNYVRGTLTPNVASLGAVVRSNVLAFFNGQIDDVAIWRRALSSNEVNYAKSYGPYELTAIFTHISVASSNVTLRWVDPTGKYGYTIQEGTELDWPHDWTDVLNATVTTNGNTFTAEFPQSPGEARFYRLIRN